MRAVLEFLTGARRGQKIVLPAGRSVSIGRTSWSELVCEDDPRMSKVHFYLKCDAHGCYLKDHRSTHGTFVNGVRVKDCLLRDGNSISAGNTTLQIYIEGDDPEVAKARHGSSWIRTDVPEDEKKASQGDLPVPFTVERCDTELTLCRGAIESISPGTLARIISGHWPAHLIVDASRMEISVPQEFGDPQYLFDWLDPLTAERASPVVISPGEIETWRSLVNDAWGQDGLVCLFSKSPPPEILAHLRNLCRAKGPGGQVRQGMFGYCWPGVLAALLSHAPRDTITRLMEGIEAILVEFPDLPDTWQLFGDERLPKMLARFGFVEQKAGVDTVPAAHPSNNKDPAESSIH